MWEVILYGEDWEYLISYLSYKDCCWLVEELTRLHPESVRVVGGGIGYG